VHVYDAVVGYSFFNTELNVWLEIMFYAEWDVKPSSKPYVKVGIVLRVTYDVCAKSTAINEERLRLTTNTECYHSLACPSVDEI